MGNRFDTSNAIVGIKVVIIFIAVLLATGFGISCQSQEPAPPATSTPGTQPTTPAVIEVVIEGFAFKPAEIKIPVGSTVTWYNRDAVIHTVTARDKTFDSGSLPRGDTYSYKFEKAGSFEYYCIPHPYMVGNVIVE